MFEVERGYSYQGDDIHIDGSPTVTFNECPEGYKTTVEGDLDIAGDRSVRQGGKNSPLLL